MKIITSNVKKCLTLAVILLFISVSVIPSTGTNVVEKKPTLPTLYDGNILYVGGSGPGNYSTIQEAIDNASNGDMVYVYDDSSPYYENVIVYKLINLIGEDRNTTIIDGMRNDNVVYVIENGVSINGFTIQNCSEAPGGFAGVYLKSDNNIVYNNIIKENGMRGIEIFYSDNNTIYKNVMADNSGEGIILVESNKNIIYNNIISGNLVAMDISRSKGNSVYKNDINLNNRGIDFYCSGYNKVYRNSIINNTQGIALLRSSPEQGYCSYNEIFENLISSNQIVGIKVSDASNNYLYHNSFFDNTQNAYDECNNSWDNGYPSGGNYWDDYVGDDFYNGPNQDIPGSDGIGDIPYNISEGNNQDRYPLMHPFELYYILNISAPPEVNEEELFNVLVKSIGGTAIPSAIVEFNDELKLTDIDGRVYFTAPQVGADITYVIIATKEGYTEDYETILVKDVPVWFNYAFVFGRLDNLTTEGEIITFEALNIRAMTFFPFTFNAYTSGELITISKNYFGLVGARFIFAFCGLIYQYPIYSMNIYSKDDSANEVIWLVSWIDGNPIGINDVETILLNESGEPQPDAEITFNELTGAGYINPGDIFTVVAPSDGYYVFMLTHKLSGATIFKSSSTHY